MRQILPLIFLLFCFSPFLKAQIKSEKSERAAPVFLPLPEEDSGGKDLKSPPPAEPNPTEPNPTVAVDPGAESISAIVRVVRSHPQSEVFFVDRKDSLIIPVNSHHNEILEACLSSSRTRTPVSLLVNLKTRRILSLGTQDKKPDKPPAGNSK